LAVASVASEAGGREHVHVSGFQLVRPRCRAPDLHGGDLQLGRVHLLGGGVVGQPRALRLHHLHGRRLLGAAVRLQRKACWEKKEENKREKKGNSSFNPLKPKKQVLSKPAAKLNGSSEREAGRNVMTVKSSIFPTVFEHIMFDKRNSQKNKLRLKL